MKKKIIMLLISMSLMEWTLAAVSVEQKENDIKGNKIFAVALEKEFTEKPDTKWNPILYCIDPQRNIIINKLKLADSGTPILLEEKDAFINIVLSYGSAANGTYVGHEYVMIYTVNPDSMQINKAVREEGFSDKYFAETNEKKDLEALQNEKKIKNLGLKYSKEKGKVYTLNLKNPNFFSLDIFDLGTSDFSESIVIPKEKEILGLIPFPKDVKLVGVNILACLFHGKVILGHFEPGYLAIVHLDTKKVDFVEIGSDPAWGIVVK